MVSVSCKTKLIQISQSLDTMPVWIMTKDIFKDDDENYIWFITTNEHTFYRHLSRRYGIQVKK